MRHLCVLLQACLLIRVAMTAPAPAPVLTAYNSAEENSDEETSGSFEEESRKVKLCGFELFQTLRDFAVLCADSNKRNMYHVQTLNCCEEGCNMEDLWNVVCDY